MNQKTGMMIPPLGVFREGAENGAGAGRAAESLSCDEMKVELRKAFNLKRRTCCRTCPRRTSAAFARHSFQAEIVVAGECDLQLGWLMDYADIPML